MKRVLVFEDEMSSQEIARRTLNSMGITEIAFACDGDRGLKILDRMEPKPDFILCDIFMPDKDGIETVTELANRGFKGGLVLITGAGDTLASVAKTIAIQRDLNFLGLLKKPLNAEQLTQVLQPLMGK
jgi:response regulator of citrate/malate metabolism